MASEDIGLAEPGALAVTLAAKEAFDFLGAPEGHLALAQAVVYLSLAPKSNAVYLAYGKAKEDVEKTEADPVPLHLRNAATALMKNIGYGEGYKYAHNFEEKVTDMQCLPENLAGRNYYRPTDQGFEARLRVRLEEIRKVRKGGSVVGVRGSSVEEFRSSRKAKGFTTEGRSGAAEGAESLVERFGLFKTTS